MLARRVIASAIFIALFLLSLLIPQFAWFNPAVIVLAALIGTYEYFRMARKRGIQAHTLLGLVFSAIVLFSAMRRQLELLPLLILLALFLTAVIQLAIGGAEDFTATVGASLFGFLYVAPPMALLLSVLLQTEIAPRAILFFVLVVWSSDTGAFFTGRAIGRRKLAPALSPGKTVEGAVGGVAFSLLSAALLVLLWPGMRLIFPLNHALLLGLLFAVVGQAGDLLESALKREAGVKDSGEIHTGMGGMLDVIDSILVCAPILFIYLMKTQPALVRL